MSDDPLGGVSAKALAMAEGSPAATSGADLEEALAPLASSDRAFASRTREAADRRADASRGAGGAIRNAGGGIGERGRRILDAGLDALPEPRQVFRQGRTAVRDQPTTALLVAGAVGFALAWLIHGRDA